MRIDRWLWCARLFKTRSLAANAVREGKVRLGGERVKPSREIDVDAALSIDRRAFVTNLCVLKIPIRRGPAGEAAGLYEETADSIERREQITEARRAELRFGPPTHGRPDKRTRRLVRSQRRDPVR